MTKAEGGRGVGVLFRELRSAQARNLRSRPGTSTFPKKMTLFSARLISSLPDNYSAGVTIGHRRTRTTSAEPIESTVGTVTTPAAA
jgi:hypothetical protein